MKSWLTFALWAIGLVVVLSWLWRKLNPAPVRPPDREPVISVTIDDPGMELGDWANPGANKEAWTWDSSWEGLYK